MIKRNDSWKKESLEIMIVEKMIKQIKMIKKMMIQATKKKSYYMLDIIIKSRIKN